MTEEYENLAAALDRLANRFPGTPSGTEIELLKQFFTLEEAALAGRLGGDMAAVEVIASRAELEVEATRDLLNQMAGRGLVWMDDSEGIQRFRLAPFVVGIYESQNLDHTSAHLFDQYMAGGGAKGILGSEPAIHRVIPAQAAIKSEWILPYDDIRAILEKMRMFRVGDCICRIERKLAGHTCQFPTRMCLSFSPVEYPPGPLNISKMEALEILDRSEEIGLVHTVSNVAEGISYVCNCCGCCCGILRGITDWGIENSVAQANFYAVIDPQSCNGCGNCVERCQVKAIAEKDGVSVVDRKRCIGCGLCVTGCPDGVARLERKPEAEIVMPPLDFHAWEQQRLANRER